MIRILIAGVIAYLVGHHVYATVFPVHAALGCSQRTCVVTFNPGGTISTFQDAARAIQQEKQWVVVDGPCVSACTILADMARERVCITRRAKFGYHSGSAVLLGLFSVPGTNVYALPYSRDTIRWINARGGLPSADSGRFLKMEYHEARQFWRTCERTR